ncbi:MAG: hypothetical protein AAFX79_09295 [Planctomycetota bacterium]
MDIWVWLILGFALGIACVAVAVPRIAGLVRSAPPPDLPESLAPGWHVRCLRCGCTRTLASVGGIRLGGNRNATKATLGMCRGCRRLAVIQIVHADRLRPDAPGAAAS